MSNQLPWQRDETIIHSQRMLKSFHYWTGRSLLDVKGSLLLQSKLMFEAPFVLISHGIEKDPIFNYGNQTALQLWQLNWDNFTQLHSRYAAEVVEQEERDRLLTQTKIKGFCDWSGIRISSTGKRFLIEDGIIWNILDEKNQMCGQAATFERWTPIN